MKNLLGSLQLFIVKEDGSENYIFQNTKNMEYADSSFCLYKRSHNEHRWLKVNKPTEVGVNWIIDEMREPIGVTPPSGLNATIQTRTGTTIQHPMLDSWTWEDPSPLGLTSGAALREMQSREQLSQRYQSHADHVREHQEFITNERQRRAAQSQADQRRREEERTRQRNPWERVRNFFGRD